MSTTRRPTAKPRRRAAPKRAWKKRTFRKKARQAKSNMDTFSLKCKVEYIQYPVQGTTVANYISGAVKFLDPANPLNPLVCTDYLIYKKLYDQVRFNRVTVRVKPKANVLDASIAAGSTNMNNSGDGRIHTCLDRDSVPPPSVDVFKRYSSYRSYSALKPWSRSYKVTWPKGVWLDTAAPTADASTLRELGCMGGIFFYAENFLEPTGTVFNQPYATLEITYSMVFRGRKGYNVSVAENGATILEDADTIMDPLVPAGYRIISGTINNGQSDQPDPNATD